MPCFLLIVALMLGCGEPSRAPTAPGGAGGPIHVTGVNEGTGGSSGAGGVGAAGGAGGETTGACDNAKDLEALAIAGRVRDVARDCAVFRCAGMIADSGAYEACVDACIENDVQGLSRECTECYGAVERCSLDSFCQLRCQSDTCNPICLSCLSVAGCTEEFEACRGIEGTECPD